MRLIRVVVQVVVVVLLANTLLSCSVSTTPDNALLATDAKSANENVVLEFSQGGISVPVPANGKQHKIQLKPGPFMLQVHGEKEAASIIAVKDGNFLLPLKESQQPLVSFQGTGYAYENSDLLVMDNPLETYDGSASFFMEVWGESPEKAIELASFLEKAVGSTPMMLFSGRAYLDPENGITDFVVNTISGSKIEEGDSVELVVFIQTDLGQDFIQMEWVEFDIEFKTY